MSRILIIGQNSFIGNSFQSYSSYRQIDKISLRKNNLDDLSFKEYDVILHLAALVHQSSKIPYEEYYKVNVELAYRVAEKARREGAKQFVFFSTIRVYGEYTGKNEIWNEYTTPKPTDNYGKSKLEAERLLNTLNTEDFAVSILRIPMVYGPDNRGNINKMIHFLEKFRFSPFRKIENERNVLYVKNLVDFIGLILEHRRSGLFVVTDPYPVSTSEIAENIIKHIDKKVFSFSVPVMFRKIVKLIWSAGYYKIFGNLKLDSSESFKDVNFFPEYAFEEGMKEMMHSYKHRKKKARKDT
jgi:UDP-glucose 4-epimerase